MNWIPLKVTLRIGCHLSYDVTHPTPMLLVLRPRLEGHVLVVQESLSFGIGQPAYEFQDSHGNLTWRSMMMPGRNEIRHDALVAVSSLPDYCPESTPVPSVDQLPADVLRYTLPSRYCDSDKLRDFAWNHFGLVPHQPPPALRQCPNFGPPSKTPGVSRLRGGRSCRTGLHAAC